MNVSSHYRSNLRDIFFNLFELLEVQSTSLGRAPFGAIDEQTTRDMLTAYERFASTELAKSFFESDRVPLRLDGDGTVTLPEGLKSSLRSFYEGNWDLLELPERLGGYGAPPTVVYSALEMTAGANPCVAYYIFGTCIARTLDRLGTPGQKERFVRNMVERRWGGTMVLTEPDAGSDVGAGRTRARHVGGELWEIEGVKRFITNGDFDSAENIVHLVLARPEGAGPGTKGLSMFIVPKFWVNEDGSLGERNGAYCTNIEKKMGIKGSATCEMTFGERGPARGLLVGDRHDGIRQMFHVIEQARMGVGVKSMSTLSTAYLNALEYTKHRVQGADMLQAADKTAARVPILRHPDVRRMLMLQKSHAEGMRALCLFTASIQDQVEILGGHTAPEARELDALNDLLLPLVKGYCSEKGYELLAQSLQCFGGSGYCQDYPIEQYARDQKIDTLYEGTTHIQALDLILRKVARDGGKTFRGLLGRIEQTAKSDVGGDALAAERGALLRGLGDIQAMFAALLAKMNESTYHVGLQGNRILFAVAEIVIGWLLVRQAGVALQKLSSSSEADRAFYQGKVASARFFCANALPGLTLTRKLVEASALDLMELPESAF
jgi:alkylation response protein AidB-like acyl-CoA dehydrogenase